MPRMRSREVLRCLTPSGRAFTPRGCNQTDAKENPIKNVVERVREINLGERLRLMRNLICAYRRELTSAPNIVASLEGMENGVLYLWTAMCCGVRLRGI